jgi:SAM-dependent methyltransferase
VDAYDRIAPVYGELCRPRKAYLAKIEKLIAARVPKGSQQMLDIGGGNGSRALRIARATGIERVILLEPSARMRAAADPACEIWPIRAEDLVERENDTNREFDVVTCLWNVFGHIRSGYRLDLLRSVGGYLLPNGLLFMDVHHRYNVREYGILRTAARMACDALVPGGNNGDVTVHWNRGGIQCSTYGHVFTQGEMHLLIQASGLQLVEEIFVNYESGEIRKKKTEGNLFYVLRRKL